MSILVYRAGSRNNVLTAMSESLTAAFSAAGADARLVSLEPTTWMQSIAQALTAGGVEHAIAFGSFSGDCVDGDGRSLYDTASVGFVSWDVDHPAYKFKRFATPVARRAQVCASASHVEFARMMGCRATPCLMTPGVDTVAATPLPLAERPIPVLAAMSWLGEPTVWWNSAKGTPTFDLVEGMVARLLADPDVDLLAAYDATVEATGLAIAFGEDVCELLANIALFVRQYDRLKLAEALVAMDIPCVVCGAGWRERLGERAHLSYADDIDFRTLAQFYGQSQIVLNLNAANGASERAMEGMAAGAVVVSDHSPLLESEFAIPGGLRFFDRSDFATLASALQETLADGLAQATADRGRALVAEGHLWSHKAQRLLEILASV